MPIEALAELNANGHVVIPNLIDKAMVTDLRDRVERILAYEREHPADPGTSSVEVDQAAGGRTSTCGTAATTRSSG